MSEQLNSEGLITYIDFLEMEGLLGNPEANVFKKVAQEAGPWGRFVIYVSLSVLGDLRILQKKVRGIEKKLEVASGES